MASQYQTENGTKKYPVDGEIGITTRGGLVVIPRLGISAGALRIDSTSVVLRDGSLYLSPESVEHIPHAYKAGEIKIHT